LNKYNQFILDQILTTHQQQKLKKRIKKQVLFILLLNDRINSSIELNDKQKEEPMDISDAQASFGSDGIIESHPTSALMIESTSTIEKSTTTVQSPTQPKIAVSVVFFL
jgi:hypothetical protein